MAVKQISIAPSANISEVAYNTDTGDLLVSFVKGSLPYRFRQVPGQVAAGFADAPSPGRYFRMSILNQYPHELLSAGSMASTGDDTANANDVNDPSPEPVPVFSSTWKRDTNAAAAEDVSEKKGNQ